jgi:hypothetical protein
MRPRVIANAVTRGKLGDDEFRVSVSESSLNEEGCMCMVPSECVKDQRGVSEGRTVVEGYVDHRMAIERALRGADRFNAESSAVRGQSDEDAREVKLHITRQTGSTKRSGALALESASSFGKDLG